MLLTLHACDLHDWDKGDRRTGHVVGVKLGRQLKIEHLQAIVAINAAVFSALYRGWERIQCF